MTNDEARKVLFLVEEHGDNFFACWSVVMDQTKGDSDKSIEIATKCVQNPGDKSKVSRFDFKEGSDDISSSKKTLTQQEVGEILVDQYKKVKAAKDRGYKTDPEKQISKWVTSDKFTLVKDVPLWAIRVYADIKNGDKSHSTGPIVLDRLKGDPDERYGSFGSMDTCIVLDGKHRVADALESGKETLDAYVGNDIKEELENHIKEFGPKRERFSKALDSYYGK